MELQAELLKESMAEPLKTVLGLKSVQLGKTLSLKQMTTRTHYPGTHKIDAFLNGHAVPLGEFELS